MRKHERRQTRTHPQLYPLISFFLGVLALYWSRLAFAGNVYSANSPLVPYALRSYAAVVNLTFSVVVTLAGAAAMLIGGLSLRRSGLRSSYGVAALFGSVAGGITLTLGLLYLSFIFLEVY